VLLVDARLSSTENGLCLHGGELIRKGWLDLEVTPLLLRSLSGAAHDGKTSGCAHGNTTSQKDFGLGLGGPTRERKRRGEKPRNAAGDKAPRDGLIKG
jgi:hypothetical protein